jgi:hypothetical protein
MKPCVRESAFRPNHDALPLNAVLHVGAGMVWFLELLVVQRHQDFAASLLGLRMEGSKIAVLYPLDFAAQDRPQSSIFNFRVTRFRVSHHGAMFEVAETKD